MNLVILRQFMVAARTPKHFNSIEDASLQVTNDKAKGIYTFKSVHLFQFDVFVETLLGETHLETIICSFGL